MATEPIIVTGVVIEDSGAFCMARVEGNDAANLTQAAVTSIFAVVLTLDGTVTTASHELVVADVIFDTLQTDDRWARANGDSTGYNLGFVAPAAWFATGGIVNVIELTVTPAAGEVFKIPFHVSVTPVLGS